MRHSEGHNEKQPGDKRETKQKKILGDKVGDKVGAKAED